METDCKKKIFIQIVSLLYIALFVYAAISKLLDFENFQIQLGQSPLLSAFAGYVSIGVPVAELMIAGLLLFPKYRLVALHLSFSLMVMFTAYIFIILNYSSYIPCSCGGILEKLGWNEHILFNLFFILLSIVSILLLLPAKPQRRSAALRHAGRLLSSMFVSIGIVVLLFFLSEEIIHHHNNFVRRFPHYPASRDAEYDLKFNSYYFAGSGNGKVYLGNPTAPLQVTVFDTALNRMDTYQIRVDKPRIRFSSIQLKVLPPYFYLVDGNMPFLFRGIISDWKASHKLRGNAYFSQIVPLDSLSIVYRTIPLKTKMNTLGLINLKDTLKIHLAHGLLEKQVDGIFDTEGDLIYNRQRQEILYVYRYRNQFITAGKALNVHYRGNTIDTVSHAHIRVAHLKSTGTSKLSAPPLTVNRASASFDDFLYVNSALPGQFEPLSMWEKASIIDVYDLNSRTYQFSFYVYNVGRAKARSFIVNEGGLYALIDNRLVRYKLGERFKRRL